MKNLILPLLLLFPFLSNGVKAAPLDHTFKTIDTCYHWLDTYQLQAKVAFANANNGALQFFDSGPIYCWRSPLGAYNSKFEDHGPEMIRIKFKAGVRIAHQARVGSYSQMQASGFDAIYSNDNTWQEYTIAPSAVESWSIYQPATLEEMKTELKLLTSPDVRDDDVFYPWAYYDPQTLKSDLGPVFIDYQNKTKSSARIYGANPENHFKTTRAIAWRKELPPNAPGAVIKLPPPPPAITIISASYGLNVGNNYLNNALVKVKADCDGKLTCTQSINPRAAKEFNVKWVCQEDGAQKELTIPAATTIMQATITCP